MTPCHRCACAVSGSQVVVRSLKPGGWRHWVLCLACGKNALGGGVWLPPETVADEWEEWMTAYEREEAEKSPGDAGR